MKQYDVIVVGGGLGGLTAGAKLAKDGKRVLLVEQHNTPGGCATTFKRKDYVMEVGLHTMDGLDEQDPKRRVFEELGVFDNVEFIKIPELYRVRNERLDIVIQRSTNETIKILIEKFSEEERGIKKFFKVIHAIRKEIIRLPVERRKAAFLLPIIPVLCPTLCFYLFKTVGEFMDSIITNEDLKLILLTNIFYYHDDPYSMSLIYFSAAQASYFSGGAYFIKGGSQKLSNYLSEIIRHNGGKVIMSHIVTEIITKNKKAVGIKYKNILSKKNESNISFAKIVIANAAVPNVITLLYGKNRLLLEKIAKRQTKSCSLISVYVGFKRELKEIESKSYSTFIQSDSVIKISDMKKNYKEDFSKRSFCFIDYSQVDSNLAPKGKSVGTVCAPDYFSDWEGLSNEEYKKKKDEAAHLFFRRLEQFIPGIMNEIECYEVGTPKTIEKYTLNPEGAVYGFAQLPRQAGIFRLPNKSPVKNLYFASAWSTPGGGFTGAILSGWFCANEVNKALKPSFFSSLLHKEVSE